MTKKEEREVLRQHAAARIELLESLLKIAIDGLRIISYSDCDCAEIARYNLKRIDKNKEVKKARREQDEKESIETDS